MELANESISAQMKNSTSTDNLLMHSTSRTIQLVEPVRNNDPEPDFSSTMNNIKQSYEQPQNQTGKINKF